jgi:hypothetical protein
MLRRITEPRSGVVTEAWRKLRNEELLNAWALFTNLHKGKAVSEDDMSGAYNTHVRDGKRLP